MKKILLSCLFMLAFGAAGVFAETIYLKDGTVVRGRIVQVDETTVMIDVGDSWKKIERSTIELIKPNDAMPGPPAAAADKSGQAIAPETDQRRESGMYIGFQVPYNWIGGDFDGTNMSWVDPGIGIGFIGGYSFNRHFALELDWAGSAHESDGETIGFGEFSLNLKGNFRSVMDQVSPFLIAGVGSFTLGDSSLMLGGYGYNLGIGLDIPVSERNTIGIALIRKFITYDEILESDYPVTLNGTIKGDTTSVRLDFTHHF
jgi:hypothetical protein